MWRSVSSSFRGRHGELAMLDGERERGRGAVEQAGEYPVAASGERRGDDRRPYDSPRHLDLSPGEKLRIVVNLAQRQHGEPQRPEQETPDPRLAARYGHRVGERVTQVGVRDADQLVECGAKPLRVALVQRLQLEPGTIEDIARQPAHASFPIFPRVLDDV